MTDYYPFFGAWASSPELCASTRSLRVVSLPWQHCWPLGVAPLIITCPSPVARGRVNSQQARSLQPWVHRPLYRGQVPESLLPAVKMQLEGGSKSASSCLAVARCALMKSAFAGDNPQPFR